MELRRKALLGDLYEPLEIERAHNLAEIEALVSAALPPKETVVIVLEMPSTEVEREAA